jgi:hypothetical protein
MPKAQTKKVPNKPKRNLRFNETWLVLFAVIFALIGSYGWLRSFAAPEDAGFFVQSNISAEEKAWFSSITGASIVILASGPVAILILWWIWRRSAFDLWARLLLTVFPLLIIVAFT